VKHGIWCISVDGVVWWLQILVAIARAGANVAILHQIPEGHVGVYWRGGALLKTITGPGIYHSSETLRGCSSYIYRCDLCMLSWVCICPCKMDLMSFLAEDIPPLLEVYL
jgi:hypothetical protein